MFNAFFVGLGLLLSPVPGPGELTGAIEAGLHGRIASPQGHPSPAPVEEANPSEPGDDPDEPDGLLIGVAARWCDRPSSIGGRGRATVGPASGQGWLRLLHHSWQLTC